MVESKNILVGIDGGGTGCRAAIAVDGKLRGIGKGGPANATTDMTATIHNILAALEEARAKSAISVSALSTARAHVGLAGVQSEETAAPIRKALPVGIAEVCEDREATVLGALNGSSGSVAAIGTGSFLARFVRERGQTRYVGGWGAVAGDQASGAWLGRSLLTQALLCFDGLEPPTPIIEQTLAEFADDAVSLSAFSQKATPAELARFAPSIVRSAETGDRFALSLMSEGAHYIERALSTLDRNANEPLCLTGGLGPHYAPFLPKLLRDCLTPAKGGALDGALLLAARVQSRPEAAP